MTAEQAFQARELSASGIWSGRIAELLDVDERDVLRALKGREFDDEPAENAAALLVGLPAPADPPSWPPPVDESTVWSTVRPMRPRTHVRGGEVRVRRVQLWGKRVWINDRDEVFCDHCHLGFRTIAQLGAPDNGCPVGLPARPGPYPIRADVDDEPRYLPVAGRYVDLMNAPM